MESDSVDWATGVILPYHLCLASVHPSSELLGAHSRHAVVILACPRESKAM